MDTPISSLLYLQTSSTHQAGGSKPNHLERVSKNLVSDQSSPASQASRPSTPRAGWVRTSSLFTSRSPGVPACGQPSDWSTCGWASAVAGVAFSTATFNQVVYFTGVTALMASFLLGFSLQYSDVIFMSPKQYTNTELDMNPTERAIESSRVEVETRAA